MTIIATKRGNSALYDASDFLALEPDWPLMAFLQESERRNDNYFGHPPLLTQPFLHTAQNLHRRSATF
jgi:hypothetical protein